MKFWIKIKNLFNELLVYIKNYYFFLYKILGRGIHCVRIVLGIELEIHIVSKNIYPILSLLNKHSLCQFKNLMDIICYDSMSAKLRFFIIYNLLSVKFNIRLRLISKINELTTVLSSIGIFKSANWLERENFDFFGIFFLWNNDLRRILTDYGFMGYPLRKDFPLTGFIETHYDDNQKRICYRPVELSQEYRNFKFKSFWNIKKNKNVSE